MNITEYKAREIPYAFNAATSSCCHASFSQLIQKFIQSLQSQPLFRNSLVSFFLLYDL